MAIARLSESLNLNSGDRFFMLHGPGIHDEFVSDDYRVLGIEEALQEWLTVEGFERVVFYAPRRGVHFRDARSHAFSRHPGAAPARAPGGRSVPQMDRLEGHLGRVSLFEQAQEQGAQPPPPSRAMGDAHAIRLLDSVLSKPEPRSAVVIHQAEVTLRHFEEATALVRVLGEWSRLSAFNRNVCLFLFGGPVEDLAHDLRDWPELHAQMVKGEPGQSGERGNVARLSGADRDEMQRLVDFARLSDIGSPGGRVRVNWHERDKLVTAMTAENERVRYWLPRLRESGEVSRAAAKAARNPWFKSKASLSNDDRPALERLQGMVGLAPVKQRIAELTALVAEDVRRREAGLSGDEKPPRLHLVFAGNPGTGKTTVARLIGEIYRDLGLLKRGHTVEVDKASDLVAGYVGQTAIRTHAKIDEALDGVLFIDEAYQFADTTKGGFGGEAVDALITRSENERHRLVIIAAGYTDRMPEFLAMNPGLPRRFPPENQMEFPDYTPDELLSVLLKTLRDQKYLCSAEAESAFEHLTRELYRTGASSAQNAGGMEALVDDMKRRRALRVREGELPVDEPIQVADISERHQRLIAGAPGQ